MPRPQSRVNEPLDPLEKKILEETFEKHHKEVAAVILEPTGSTFGKVPIDPQFLTDLRNLTKKHGIVLIFDEVVTGFRCSTGGAQGFYGVTPDLTTVAKILGGGYPAGAVVGRTDIMDVMEFGVIDTGIVGPRVPHQGTYNASPISAAAGIATLRLLQSSDLIERANRTAEILRGRMNAILAKIGSAATDPNCFSPNDIEGSSMPIQTPIAICGV